MAKKIHVSSHFSQMMGAQNETFEQRKQFSDSIAYIQDLLQLLKFPRKLRELYFNNLRINPGIHPEDNFRTAYPTFPVRIVTAPQTKTKTIFRLDNLISKDGQSLTTYYLQMADKAVAEQEQRCICMLMRLPYQQQPNLQVLHDFNNESDNVLNCDGVVTCLWSEVDPDRRYRIFLQDVVDFFNWSPIKQHVDRFIAGAG